MCGGGDIMCLINDIISVLLGTLVMLVDGIGIYLYYRYSNVVYLEKSSILSFIFLIIFMIKIGTFEGLWYCIELLLEKLGLFKKVD